MKKITILGLCILFLLGLKGVNAVSYRYSGYSFNVGGEDNNPTGLTWNGSSWFVLGDDTDKVYEYNSSGNYTGFNFSLDKIEGSAKSDITWNGSSFFILTRSSVWEYNTSGNYTGYFFNTSSETTLSTSGLTWNGSSFFIVNLFTKTIFEYNSSGNYTGFSFSLITEQDDATGIADTGGSFFVIGYDPDIAVEYDKTGTATSYSFSVTDEETLPHGIYYNGSSLFVVGYGSDTVYEYESFIPAIDDVTFNSSVGYGYNVTINATITDSDMVNTTWITITFPNMTSINFTMSSLGDVYQYNFTDTWQYGTHNFTIYYNDSLNNIGSYNNSFNVSVLATINVNTIKLNYNLSQQVNLTDPPSPFFEQEEDRYIQVIIELDNKIKPPNFIKKTIYWLRRIETQEIPKYENNVRRKKIMKEFKQKPKYIYKTVISGFAANITIKEYNELLGNEFVRKIWEEGMHNVTMNTAKGIMEVEEVWRQVNLSGDNITGKGIRVAVIDTGIDYTHRFFGNCTLTNLTDGKCNRIEYGYDFVNNDNDPFDDHGHGTHVSGIIGGYDSNNLYTGVAYNVTFLEYKVCDSSGSCPDADIIAAIENATNNNVDIIHISLGAKVDIDEEPLGPSLKTAYDNGIMIIASAGNDGPSLDTMSCPACLSYVIAVGSSTKGDSISYFSSRGYAFYSNGTIESIKPDILAPGSSITSSVPTGSCRLCDSDGIDSLSGTSMSAPQISGIMSLLIHAHPDWNLDQLKSALMNNAEDLDYVPLIQGSGRANAIKSYNSSGAVIPHNFFIGMNIDESTNLSVSKTFNISGLQRNQTFNISYVSSGFNIIVNTTNISTNTTFTNVILVNFTRDNTNSSWSTENGILFLNSSTESYRIPLVLFNNINPSGCPAFNGLYINSDTTFKYNLTCKYIADLNPGLIIINKSNVILNCNDTKIIGNKDMSQVGTGGRAIYSYDKSNVTIKNCDIAKFNTDIYAYGNDYTITNNTLKNATYWILLNANNSHISNNYFYNSDFWGIFTSSSAFIDIYDNTFNKSVYSIITTGGQAQRTWRHSKIYNNKIYNSTYGFEISDGYNISIFNNTFTDGWWSMEIFDGTYINVENNTINGDRGIGIHNQDPLYSIGINNILRNNLINVSEWGILFYGEYTNNFTIYDSTIIIRDVDPFNSIKVFDGASVIIVNTTYNDSIASIGTNSKLYRKWYVNVNVTNQSTNEAISGVTVTVYENSSGTWNEIDTDTTDSNGLATKLEATQYLQQTSKTFFHINISVSKKFYYPNSTVLFNISDNTKINLTMLYGRADSDPPVITVVFPLNNSIYNTTDIVLNITIDEDCDVAFYSLNGTANVSMHKINATYFNKSLILTDNSNYNVTFWANDTSGNWGTSGIYYFTINSSYVAPGEYKSMINRTGTNNFFGYLTMKVQKNISGWVDYYTVTDNTLISVTGIYALDTVWYADGAYTTNSTGTFRVLAELKDPNGKLLKNSETTYFNDTYKFSVLDVFVPTVSIITPTDGKIISTNYTVLNYTVIDNYDTSLTCWYILNVTTTASPNNPITNGTYDDINMSSLLEATYPVYVKCEDNVPQNGTSSTKTFTVDLTAPVIYNGIPVNNSKITSEDYETFEFNVNESVLVNDTSCFLYWKKEGDAEYFTQSMDYYPLVDPKCTYELDVSSFIKNENLLFYFSVKDEADHLVYSGNGTNPYVVTKSEETAPSFSNNRTNADSTTYNGTDVQINLTIIDDVGIVFYRLATTDTSGRTWANESIIDTGEVLNITPIFNHTISNFPIPGGTFSWRVWANDTSGNVNQSQIYTFVVQSSDLTSPTYSNSYSSFQNNASTLTKINGVVNWSINLVDETNLNGYIFTHNNTGTLTNGSFTLINDITGNVSETVTITLSQGNYICGQYWFNDTSNNINQTNLSCFVVIDTLPTIPTSDSLTPNSPIITEELTGVCSGSNDADSDTITYHCRFYDITDSNERQAFSSDCTYQLSSPNDLADQFRVDCRATTTVGNSTDRTGTDLETVRTTSLYEINTFSDGTSSGRMTFLSSIYKNISIPYWAVVTKAELDLEGFPIGYGNLSDFNFSVTPTFSGTPTGLAWNGSSYFVASWTTDKVYEFNSSGNNTGFNFSVSTQAIEPTSITWNGSSFFVFDLTTEKVYEYNSTGDYTSFSFDVDDVDSSPMGVCWNGSSFFVYGTSTDIISEYNVSGNYTGFNFSLSYSFYTDIACNKNVIYLSSLTTDEIIAYDTSGDILNFSLDISNEEGLVGGMTFHDDSLYIIGNSEDKVFEYDITLSYPTNVTIRTNKEITYQKISNFTGTVTDIDLNISSLQRCVDSVSSGNVNCTLNFTSATPGILEYSNIGVDYLVPLNITFKDEKSDSIIEGETLSIFLETTGFSQLYSSDNPFKVNLSIAGTYDVKASSTNYPSREFVIDVLEARNNLILYLINSTDSAEKTFYLRGTSLNALEDVYINFSRVIDGVRTTIAEEYTDYDGAVSLYLDENYEYRIIFSKDGYDTKIINLEPTSDEYIITLTLSTELYNVSVYEGIRYRFSPSDTILNNNTKYNFTFTLNSSVWEVTNCNLTLKNGSAVLSTTSSYTSNSCYLRLEQNTFGMTNITSEAVYELDLTYDFTVIHQYSIIYTYEGEFSLKNFLDDLSDFGMAGFDNFGRMILAFIVIFVILAMAAMKMGFENKEIFLFMFWALVGFFSFVNWFYLDFVPNIIGLRKYFIFYLITLVCFAFIIDKFRK